MPSSHWVGSDLIWTRLGPTTVNSASLQLVGQYSLAKITRSLGTNGIVIVEFRVNGVHEHSGGVYSEAWLIVTSVQRLAGPSWRLGLNAKSSLLASAGGNPVFAGSTSFSVDVSGGNLRLLAQSAETHGSAKVWAILTTSPSENG